MIKEGWSISTGLPGQFGPDCLVNFNRILHFGRCALSGELHIAVREKPASLISI